MRTDHPTSRQPAKRLFGRRAPLAITRSLPWSSVKRVTSLFVSPCRRVRRTTASVLAWTRAKGRG